MKIFPCLFAISLLAAPSPGARGEESVSSPDSSGLSFGHPAPDAPGAMELHPVISQRAAYARALGGTLGPSLVGAGLMAMRNSESEFLGAALLLYGALIGPSMGQFHAKSPGSAWVGIGLRVAGVVLAGAMAMNGAAACASDDCGGASEIPLVVMWGVGVAYSLFDTKLAVDRANEKARKAGGIRTSFAPALVPVGEGRRAPGLAFNASF